MVSQEHSGSTLLTFLLNIHQEICSVAEPCVVGEKIPVRWEKKSGTCSCLKPYYSCSFWNRLLAGLAARGYTLNSPDYLQYKIFKNKLMDRVHLKSYTSQKLLVLYHLLSRLFKHKKRQMDRFTGTFVDVMFDITGSSVYLDASKSPNYLLHLKNNPYLDLYVINLTRDGRGVLNSWLKLKKYAGFSFTRCFQHWAQIERRRHSLLSRIPRERVFDIPYEVLCQAPLERLNDILHFLGLDSVEMVNYKTDVEHHFFGNRMRRNDVVEIKLDEKWKRELSAENLELFDKLGGKQYNRRNGYDE